MIYKLYLRNKPLFVMAVVFISTTIFITAPIVSTSIVSNVNAADKEGPGYTCSHIPGSGTIGQVKCCATSGEMYCTICDNTTPPSNCQPRTLGKFDSGTVLHSNEGGVLSNDDSSNTGDSNTVNPDKIIEGGTFNDDSGSGNTGDSNGGADSNKINSGAVFNQQ
ncbi:MAG TPA: hypothetical protein VJP58_10575 [Candidatus Nitrosocosmicus sp.]|nr:hypothetical protein [Candidatus Nitrosocosmicus sp.]